MKRLIMVLILVSLVFTPVFSIPQASAQENLIGGLPGVIIPITPIIDPLIIPLLEINSVSVKAVPLYRFVNNSLAGYPRHNYAVTQAARDNLEATGWVEDGIVTYISPIPLPGTMPLYRCSYANWINVLTLYPADAVARGYTIQGVLGNVYNYTATGAEKQFVFRHTRTGTNYQFVDYLFKPSTTPVSGYTEIAAKFKGLKSAQTLQEIKINPVGASQTGNAYLALSWTSKTSTGISEVFYSTDNGATYTSIVKKTNELNNNYSWKMPNITSSQVRVMVKWSINSYTPPTAWARTAKFSITKDIAFLEFIPLIPSIPLFDFAPASPTNLNYSPGTDATPSIILYWVDNANNETGYKIERKSGAGAFAQIATTAADMSDFEDTTIDPDTEYTYRVKASGSLVDSGYTDELSAIFDPPVVDPATLTPDAPTALTASELAGATKKAVLSWTKPSGSVTGYLVERKTTGSWGLIGTTATDLTYTDVAIDNSVVSATYRVKALNEGFESPASNEATVAFAAIVDGTTPVYDGTQASYFEADINQAYAWDLTYPGVMYDFKKKITREEFCVISVKLYEKLTGTTAAPGTNPFVDTSNEDVLKAYSLGIVKGISANQFAPGNNITRQEMCKMIYNALLAAGESTALVGDPAFPYTDKNSIASWALNEVKFCNQNSIMLGTTPTTISPLVNTPREQAIVLVKRTYDAFK